MNPVKIIDSDISQSEIFLSDVKEVREFLHRLSEQGNRVVLLELPNIGILTIGIGKIYGFVEFMSDDEKTPYLLATDPSSQKLSDSYIEFDSGGTITPIPIDKCLTFDTVINIVLDFIRDGMLPNYVEWQEV